MIRLAEPRVRRTRLGVIPLLLLDRARDSRLFPPLIPLPSHTQPSFRRKVHRCLGVALRPKQTNKSEIRPGVEFACRAKREPGLPRGLKRARNVNDEGLPRHS